MEDHIDQDLEFLNYEGVCPAEKEILRTILRGGDSKEYSKGLFCFDTPFNGDGKADSIHSISVDIGSLVGDIGSIGDLSVASQSTSNNDVAEVSVQNSQTANGTVLPIPPSIPHAVVSQAGPPHHYYPGQPHMTVSVSSAACPVPSVGPNSGSNPPSGAGNPMLMFSHPIPQMMQSPAYYHPPTAYYGPQGGQPHLSFVPVNENSESGYHPQGHGHHKVHHDSHHAVPHSSNTASGQQGGAYNKNRRNKPQQPQQQQQPHYYYPSYYGQVPYYNQQQLQNVTGSPIIMTGAPNMYALPPQHPHHPGMYNQGPPPGNEMDRLPPGGMPPQMIQMQNEMSFAQHHPPPSHSQIYPHNSPTHSSTRVNYNQQQQQPSSSLNRGSGALPPQSDSNALAAATEQQQNSCTSSEERPSQKQQQRDSQISATDAQVVQEKTSEVSSSSNNSSTTITAAKENYETSSSVIVEVKSHNNPVPDSNILNSDPMVNGDHSPPSNKISPTTPVDDRIPQESSPSTDESRTNNNNNKNKVAAIFKTKATSAAEPNNKKATTAAGCKIASVNGGDTVNEMDVISSEIRDNVSADSSIVINDSTTTIDQEAKNKTSTSKSAADISIQNVSAAVNSSGSSRSVNPSSSVENVKDGAKTKESGNNNVNSANTMMKQPAVEPTPQQQAKNRSWASIASIKSAGGDASAATRPVNHSQPNHLAEDHHSFNSVGLSSNKSTGQNNVPSSDEKYVAHDFHLDTTFDAARLSDETDPIAIRLGEHLLKYTLDHQSIPLAPRGLCNQSNYCFLNATLQALLSCPTFVNMFRAMTPIIGRMPCKATPIIQSVYDFVHEFSPLLRSQSTKKDRMREGFCVGPNLEPTGIRKCLALLSKDTFKVEGRQEDAEEFLSHLLNGLHDEMIKVIKWAENKKERLERGPEPPVQIANVVNGEDEDIKEEDDDQWQVMGAKNKSCLTRRTAITKSPISEAFLGQMCLSLSRVNSMKKADLEPFFTLQLAIQNDNIKSVRDALEAVSIKEEVSGITSSSGSAVEAWRQVSLEELPPVLVLHLKRFVYEKSGILKINKKLEFNVDLEIGKDLLSNNSKSKLTLKQRQYKLFAVVYHDGEEAHKGHYVADCFHTSGGTMWGQWGWLRYDDTTVKTVNESNMLNPLPPRVPYLLYYRRQDTIQQQQNKKERS